MIEPIHRHNMYAILAPDGEKQQPAQRTHATAAEENRRISY
jgi:hypothetical protein